MRHVESRRSEGFNKESDQQIDWWDNIDDDERAEIEEGLAQADRGEVMSHKEVMAKYQKFRDQPLKSK